MLKEAVLYNKQTPVCEVIMEDGNIKELGAVYNFDQLPLYIRVADNCGISYIDMFNRWLTRRRMPDDRVGLADAKIYNGEEPYSNINMMFSLTDQYWFKTDDSQSWRKCNFFTNKYFSAIGQSTFTPWMDPGPDIFKESPDLTTNGVLAKVWVQNPDTLVSFLIKAGSKKFGQIPLSEVLGSLVMRKIDLLPYVRYDLCINGMQICSSCRNFVDETTEFVPAQAIFLMQRRSKSMSKYEHLVEMCLNYGLKRPDEFVNKMLLCDSIMGNTDRHFGNFGALRNVDTGEVKFAPLFDFGSAFKEFRKNGQTETGNKFFLKEDVERALRYYGRLSCLGRLGNTSDLFYIIDTYPDLTVEQKDRIKEGILRRTGRFLFSQEDRGLSR